MPLEAALFDSKPLGVADDISEPAGELWWNLGDGGDQAAFCAGVSITSTPSRKVMPWMTLGNWFSPLSLRQVLAAA
ncbi:MAG: hypothetical protein HIU90_17395, partial [Proteobacteria bacterium]|nr:hypothetical protein [Pseudomonadota bacterium]